MLKLNSSRVFIIVFLGLISLTSYFIGFNYYNSIKQAEAHNFEKLTAIAATTVLSIDGDNLEQLLKGYPNKDDIIQSNQDPNYLELHTLLKQCAQTNGITSPIYTIQLNENTGIFEFGVSSSDKPYFRHSYSDSPEGLIDLYERGGSIDRYKTARGEWLSVIYPIKSKANKVVAALELDLPFGPFISNARASLITNSLWSSGIYLVIGFFMFQFIARALKAEEKSRLLAKEKKDEKDYKQNELKSSINYARKIQEALWPKNEVIKKEFAEFFALNMPKDTVSGDFYWHRKIEGTDSFIIIHADCTGHGVPGAMMSVLGNTIFNEIVVNYGITEPDQILNLTNKKLIHILQQKHEENLDDGMAVSVALINKKTQTLKYAGAYQNGVVIRNGQLIKLQGDKYPVGGAHYNPDRTYTSKTILLEEEDCLYLYSDGFRDQFGGPQNKKFLGANFHKMLLEHSRSSMEIQKQCFVDVFKKWMGNLEQVDDVSLIGIRF